MSPEAQRIAIAEACGWKSPMNPENIAGMKGWISADWNCHWLKPNGEDRVGISSVPDYPNDLNAMHAAEKTLDDIKFYNYQGKLWSVCDERNYISATAAQRAEAFLKTLGLWKEAQS